MNTTLETSIGARAQAAYEALTNGMPIPEAELQDLAEADSRFTITQGEQVGIFNFGNHFMEYGSKVHVVVRAKTRERSEDLIRLKTDMAGRPLFRIGCLAELIEDPA